MTTVQSTKCTPAAAAAWVNPLRDKRDKGLPRITGPWAMVIFGIIGDLARKKLMPAPRDEPRIEVTLNIDAKGILYGTARDKDTNANQCITISEQSTSRRVGV